MNCAVCPGVPSVCAMAVDIDEPEEDLPMHPPNTARRTGRRFHVAHTLRPADFAPTD